jgi:hypothetical protein
MDAYRYDPATGEYRGTVRANADQKHPGQYILPGHATFAAPPKPGDHEAAVYRDGAWKLVPDWRGVKRYDKADGTEITFALGEEPDETMTDIPRPTDAYEWTDSGWKIPLETARVLKLAEIAAARYEAETGGVAVGGMTVQTDRESQALITGAALAATLDPGYSCRWKTAAGFVELNAAQVVAVAQAVRAHVQSCFDKEAELAAVIAAAETEEDLEAIAWAI